MISSGSIPPDQTPPQKPAGQPAPTQYLPLGPGGGASPSQQGAAGAGPKFNIPPEQPRPISQPVAAAPGGNEGPKGVRPRDTMWFDQKDDPHPGVTRTSDGSPFGSDQIPSEPFDTLDGQLPAALSLPRRATITLNPEDSVPGAGPGGDSSLTQATLNALQNAEEEPDFVFYEVIGQGGQGVVWRAWQRSLSREVAIKQLTDKSNDLDGFLREAYVAAELDHPNIVPVHDMGLTDHGAGKPRPLLAMKLVRGKLWKDSIEDDRRARDFSLDNFLAKHLRILLDVCNAVAYSHSKGIIHRDLKPHQVMVGEYGEVYLMDWGLAALVDARPGHKSLARPLAKSANRAGTPAYMAPEQTRQDPALLGYHTDIYLLGGILFHLVSGFPPHPGDTAREAFQSSQRNRIIPLSPDTPDTLKDLIHRSMHAIPAKRPATAKEFRDVLESYISGSDRRRNSVALTREAEEALRRDRPTYQTLSEASNHVARASGLWPENPAIPAIRQKLVEQYARVALDNNHLVLARLQAERVDDGGARGELVGKVDKAQEAMRRGLNRPLFTPIRYATLGMVCALVSICVMGLIFAARTTLQNEVRSKTRAIASLAARLLDPADLQAIGDAEEEMAKEEFKRVHQSITRTRDNNPDIAFIYTMRKFPGAPAEHWKFIVDSQPEDEDENFDGIIQPEEEGSPPGLLYEDGTQAMIDALDAPTAEQEFTVDQWGTFLSGFAPIKDPETGETVAIVGVDVHAEELAKKFSFALWVGVCSMISLSALISLTLIAVFGQRRALEIVQELDGQIKHQISDIRGKDISLA